MPLRPHKNKW